MDPQRMQIFIQDQIRKLIAFRGNCNEDISQWLYNTETVLDSVQLQTSNKFLVVQSYLIGTASVWFDFHKSDIHDWDTFKHEILKAFQPASNRTLSMVEKRSISVQTVNSSSVSFKTTPDSSPTFQNNFSAVIDPSGSNSNERSSPSPGIETSTTPEPVINDDQHLTVVAVPESSSPDQLVKQNSTENLIVDDIPNVSTSTITDPQSRCSSTAAADITIVHECELQNVESNEMNSNSLNDTHVANDEFIYAIESVKVNAQVTSDNTDFGTYVFRDLISSMIFRRFQIKNHTVNVTFSTNHIYI
ncbi:unnamed protein product, partial [Rotaria magnacalcarata]